MSAGIWYFAYGSNLDRDRFRARVGPWSRARQAFLDDYQLRFSAAVTSEGGGGAVIQPAAGHGVYGVAYRITTEQLQAMDREEFDPERDRERLGRRISVDVVVEQARVTAQAYTIEGAGDRGCRPSSAYLGHIIRGLRQAGYDEAVVQAVRAIAAAEPAAASSQITGPAPGR